MKSVMPSRTPLLYGLRDKSGIMTAANPAASYRLVAVAVHL
ncbi:hypothetical protein NOR51B_2365 [Luminiphilus syltensis NOR5-1B]|uniref:Uncharacterized protein n=1 Tax=Luminiphilus syltensis NOR5-1B TaxID=565045 RepID=B8KUP0_9GAMM|nr:hypothetical protein NOR51B_2365 [Luminiphilus syltensis NOR5-1B]